MFPSRAKIPKSSFDGLIFWIFRIFWNKNLLEKAQIGSAKAHLGSTQAHLGSTQAYLGSTQDKVEMKRCHFGSTNEPHEALVGQDDRPNLKIDLERSKIFEIIQRRPKITYFFKIWPQSGHISIYIH